MNQIVLPTPAMALDLAQILFRETQSVMKLEWFSPLKVQDQGDIWFLSGKVDPNLALPADAMDDQFENPIFHMHVVKTDSEVKDIGISYGMKLPPAIKAHIRATLDAEGITLSDLRAKQPGGYCPDIWLNELLHGGTINSSDAAFKFGELIFDNHLPSPRVQTQNMRAELNDGIWHVTGQTQGRRAELAFRRSNAQVISLDLQPT
jgi:hypothetical protein